MGNNKQDEIGLLCKRIERKSRMLSRKIGDNPQGYELISVIVGLIYINSFLNKKLNELNSNKKS